MATLENPIEDVEGLIAYLQTLPPKTKVGQRPSGGAVAAGLVPEVVNVAQHKVDTSYYAWLGDKVWKGKKHLFNKAFKVLIFW